MNRDQVTRRDFPEEDRGYDRASVDAHLVAVEALLAASEAEVAALKVERDALRLPARVVDPPAVPGTFPERGPATGAGPGAGGGPATGAGDEPAPGDGSEPVAAAGGEAQAAAQASDDEVSARLVATKMVMDGAERESIRERLEREYDLSDTDGLIDDLFERLG